MRSRLESPARRHNSSVEWPGPSTGVFFSSPLPVHYLQPDVEQAAQHVMSLLQRAIQPAPQPPGQPPVRSSTHTPQPATPPAGYRAGHKPESQALQPAEELHVQPTLTPAVQPATDLPKVSRQVLAHVSGLHREISSSKYFQHCRVKFANGVRSKNFVRSRHRGRRLTNRLTKSVESLR